MQSSKRHLLIAATTLCAMISITSARASVIDGTFTGIARSGTFQSPGDLTGATISGSFDIASLAGATSQIPGGGGTFLLPAGSVNYTFNIPAFNQTITFSAGPTQSTALFLNDNGTTQTLTLEAPYSLKGGTTISLTGPQGSLFTDVKTVQSLHVGSGVSLVSPIILSLGSGGGATIDVTSETITGQNVPEAPSWTILVAGLAALVIARGAFRNAFSRRSGSPMVTWSTFSGNWGSTAQ